MNDFHRGPVSQVAETPDTTPTPDTSAPAIRVRRLRKAFDSGRVTALDLDSLTVGVGEFVAITGPSGCGKSTLLHLLAALDRPTTGEVSVLGHDLRRLSSPRRFRRFEVGIVFQLHNLIPQLTARQNVEVAMFGTGLSRRQRRDRATDLLGDVGLAAQADRPPTRLSGGERQRVAIARALANSPRLLLADEPTGSLDTDSIDRFLDLLQRLRDERDLTILLVTHDARVASVADRVMPLARPTDVAADAGDGSEVTGAESRRTFVPGQSTPDGGVRSTRSNGSAARGHRTQPR